MVASLRARIVACSVASTVRLASGAAVVPKVLSVTVAVTLLRTSLTTTIPPAPTESESEMLKPPGKSRVVATGFHHPRSA